MKLSIATQPQTKALFLFFFIDPATTQIYTLSLHDALPICGRSAAAEHVDHLLEQLALRGELSARSEEHTSELQSPYDLVCRLLLEKKNRLGFHPLRQRALHSSGTWPWIGCGFARRIRAWHYRHRPAPIRIDFRAFPESGSHFSAGY